MCSVESNQRENPDYVNRSHLYNEIHFPRTMGSKDDFELDGNDDTEGKDEHPYSPLYRILAQLWITCVISLYRMTHVRTVL